MKKIKQNIYLCFVYDFETKSSELYRNGFTDKKIKKKF